MKHRKGKELKGRFSIGPGVIPPVSRERPVGAGSITGGGTPPVKVDENTDQPQLNITKSQNITQLLASNRMLRLNKKVENRRMFLEEKSGISTRRTFKGRDAPYKKR